MHNETNDNWARGPKCPKCGHDRYKVELNWTTQMIEEAVCGECLTVYKDGKVIEEREGEPNESLEPI